jgi:hypothetical protein
VLVRFHLVGLKTILRYLKGAEDLGCGSRKGDLTMVGYVGAGYMSDPIMPDHRLVLCFSVVVQPNHGGL